MYNQEQSDYQPTQPQHGNMNRNPSTSMYQNSMMDEGHKKHLQDFCKSYKNYYVVMEMNDGKQYEGIIVNMDNDNVYLLMPIGEGPDDNSHHSHHNRQYGYGPGFGGGYVPRRFRRFHPFFFPFFGIRRFFFPFFY